MAQNGLIEKWADAIQKFEGWSKGSRSYRNHNPGNLRFIGQSRAHPDSDGFAVFDSYEEGRQSLVHLLQNAATGKSSVYKPQMSLVQFFEVYAPAADHNKPSSYAAFVAGQLGVDVNAPISQLA